jgi:hypothetical protein
MAEAVSDHEDSFLWNGRSIPCVRRDMPSALEAQAAGGDIDGFTYWLTAAKNSFPGNVFPVDGDDIDGGVGQVKFVNGHKKASAAQITFGVKSYDK